MLSASSTVALEGFDPATGHTVWSFAAGHDPGLITEAGPPPQVGATTVVLPIPGGQVVIDLTTGSRQPVTPGLTAWCQAQVPYTSKPGEETVNGTPSTKFLSQALLSPCTASGKTMNLPKTAPAFVGAIGAAAGGLIIWTGPHGITAVPPTP